MQNKRLYLPVGLKVCKHVRFSHTLNEMREKVNASIIFVIIPAGVV